jgi:hypothetical protein
MLTTVRISTERPKGRQGREREKGKKRQDEEKGSYQNTLVASSTKDCETREKAFANRLKCA